jgi:tRNA(fMet)-specific endonuclease VapC
MILLDTDHLTVLQTPDADRRPRLVSRLALASEPVGTTIVNVEEQMRGWLASIAKERQAARQVRSYARLAGLFAFFADYEIAAFDPRAAALFDTYGGIRIGASDRKIAAIAVVNNALLLTANRRDFEQVPGLRFDNWMD